MSEAANFCENENSQVRWGKHVEAILRAQPLNPITKLGFHVAQRGEADCNSGPKARTRAETLEVEMV